MTEQEKQQLNQKLAEWTGFKQSKDFNYLWYPLNREGGEYFTTETLPFIQSLDACFKWLVPELHSLKLEYDYFRAIQYNSVVAGKTKAYARGETPALALCLAIEKLIDSQSIVLIDSEAKK